MTEVEKELWVENRLGLHARPVAKIATMAQHFEAEITLEKDGLVVNARDLLAVLALDCPREPAWCSGPGAPRPGRRPPLLPPCLPTSLEKYDP